MLVDGGNAVDAAVAVLFCIGVINSFSSGIGGYGYFSAIVSRGGFMLIRLASGNATVLDFREVAPAAAFKDMFGKNSSAAVRGPLAIAVPGEVRGLYEANRR